MENFIKIVKLKAGDLFEMAGREYVITRGGHGYPDVEKVIKLVAKLKLLTIQTNRVSEHLIGNLWEKRFNTIEGLAAGTM